MATDRSAAGSSTTGSPPGIREDKDLVRAAAARLRHTATQGAYRGLHRPEHAYALASALDMAELRWVDHDAELRDELRRCCRVLLDLPAAPDRPR